MQPELDEITPPTPEKHTKRNISIIGGIVVIAVVIIGVVIFQYVSARQQEAAREAAIAQEKAEEAAREKKLREGNVKEIESIIEGEIDETETVTEKLLFSSNDALQKEANSAVVVGKDNATNL